jgi:hypothetical protein
VCIPGISLAIIEGLVTINFTTTGADALVHVGDEIKCKYVTKNPVEKTH